jgi:hypothetical protein
MRRSLLAAFLLWFLVSTIALATEKPSCEKLGPSDDGVPAAYYQAECKGREALRARQFKEAEVHFRAALNETIFESPNFELKAELGWSLCRQGKRREGLRELRELVCMAEVELGRRQCSPEQRGLPKTTSPACAEICEATMSVLSERGRELRASQLKQARTWARRCEA